jgi:hypothetical protein
MGVSGIRACILAALVALAVLVGARIDPAAGQSGVTPGGCQVSNCNAFKPQVSGDCAAYTGLLCNLSQSGGNVTWCNLAVGGTCMWFKPTQNNSCDGYCVGDATVGCTVKFQKCSNPPPP